MTTATKPLLSEYLIAQWQELNERIEDCKWQQGDLIAEYLDDLGLDKPLRSADRARFYKEFGEAVGVSHFTIRERYKTSLEFPRGTRAADRSWYFHSLLARNADNPIGWLDLALGRGWQQTDIEAILRETKGSLDHARMMLSEDVLILRTTGGDPDTLTRNATARVKRILSPELWLELHEADFLSSLSTDDEITITVKRR